MRSQVDSRVVTSFERGIGVPALRNMDKSAGKSTGDHQWSVDESFAALYVELRALAHSRLKHNEPITLLNTTALVHESYLRLVQAGGVRTWERPQFLAYAASAMRSIIVDFVRRRRAERRGSGDPRVSIDIAEGLPAEEKEILRVSEALSELEKVDERLVKVVEMNTSQVSASPKLRRRSV